MSTTLNYQEAESMFGKPALDIEFDPNVCQYYNDTCAIQSQRLILNDFGFDVTQEELIETAKLNGWYAEGYGTPSDKVGLLLEHYGVTTSTSEGNNIFNIANELAQGHQIIVAVDSDEIWTPGIGEDFEDLMFDDPNHALIVAGLDTSDPTDIKVILTDPGSGALQKTYSEKEFMDAWKDSNCYMTTTTQSPAEFMEDDSWFGPLDFFANIPSPTLQSLSESNINVGDAQFDQFFTDLLNNPSAYLELTEQYEEIFSEVEIVTSDIEQATQQFDNLIEEYSDFEITEEMTVLDSSDIDILEDFN